MQDNQNFLDKNTILATALILLIWFGWGYFFQPPKPSVQQKQEVADKISEKAKDSSRPILHKEAKNIDSAKQDPRDIVEHKALSFDYKNMSFAVSTKGMGLENIVLHQFKTRDYKEVRYHNGQEALNFENKIDGKELYFDLEKISEREVKGVYEDENLRIEKLYTINESMYSIDVLLKVSKPKDHALNLETYLIDLTEKKPDQSIFNPSFARQEVFVYANNSSEREMYYIGEPFEQSFSNVAIAALSSHYFTRAVIDYSDFIPKFTSEFITSTKETLAKLTYPKTKKENYEIVYKSYFGPKKSSIVSEIDDRFTDVVDYGSFSALAKPILRLLVFLYDIFKNYGLAIILLTVLVRLAVLPFNIMSYKSMKGMQEIQPLLKDIREKQKDDPVKMNQELMAVMKENKVNPMGGCLPMLLQFPIFIALYRVLGQSIELYQAPFMLWIDDLSLKDPFYVLPVLMGITMYLQQKFTPTAMDPTQAKIMMFLPVVFSLMMIALPSGLTLYIFISTLFAVIQQKILMKTV